MTELPEGWQWSTIGHLAEYVQRGKSPMYCEESDLPVINQRCVRWDGVDERYLKFVHPEQWPKWSEERFLRSGDLLWNSTGTGTIGRAAVFQGLKHFARSVCDSHVTVIRSNGCVPKLLHAWIRAPHVQRKLDSMQSGSTNQVELSRAEVLATEVPVPPWNEQCRIVDKIEALTARSRRAKEALDEVPALLDKLRQSILAAAFRGDLTKDWRAAHPDVEPASTLLERIRQERRRRWEAAELAKMDAKGKRPKGDKWMTKYKEPAPVDTDGLPALPEGWAWGATAELADPDTVITYGIVLPKEHIEDGVPYIRGQDIQNGEILKEQLLRTAPEIAAAHSRSELRRGDVLLCVIRHLKVALVGDGLDGANLTQGTVRIRPSFAMRGPFLARYLAGPEAQAWMKARHFGLAMPRINVEDAREVPVPVPPIEEQEAIEQQVERLLTAVNAASASYDGAHSRFQAVDAAILTKAFRGELVPHDPNDEPASVLLDRIRTEREAAAPAKERASKKKTRKTP